MTGMEYLDFALYLVIIAAAAAIINRVISLKDQQVQFRQETERKKALQNAAAARARAGLTSSTEPDQGNLGEWVPQLISSFGLDPALLFEDEMPEDLKRFLPLAKAFLDKSGGITGLISKFGGSKPEDTAEHLNIKWGV